MNHRTITVALGDRSYPVYLGAETLNTLGAYCSQHGIPTRVVVIADRNSARAALKGAVSSLNQAGFQTSTILMPPGERQKSLSRAEAIHSAMLKMQIPRNAAVIALGGGVVGDVAGFVASTYRRGLPFIQCPTTLLSKLTVPWEARTVSTIHSARMPSAHSTNPCLFFQMLNSLARFHAGKLLQGSEKY